MLDRGRRRTTPTTGTQKLRTGCASGRSRSTRLQACRSRRDRRPHLLRRGRAGAASPVGGRALIVRGRQLLETPRLFDLERSDRAGHRRSSRGHRCVRWPSDSPRRVRTSWWSRASRTPARQDGRRDRGARTPCLADRRRTSPKIDAGRRGSARRRRGPRPSRLDVLVNNAAFAWGAPMLEHRPRGLGSRLRPQRAGSLLPVPTGRDDR